MRKGTGAFLVPLWPLPHPFPGQLPIPETVLSPVKPEVGLDLGPLILSPSGGGSILGLTQARLPSQARRSLCELPVKLLNSYLVLKSSRCSLTSES